MGLRPLKRPWLKILYLVLGIGALLLILYLRPACAVKSLIGVPCPSCGLTRAWLSVLQLDFRAAFSHHAMFWLVPVVGFYFLFDMHPFRSDKVNYGILIGIGAAFVIYYLFRLIVRL